MTAEIAKKIVALRKKNGITQQALSKALGVSNRAVSNWEHETSIPTIENLYQIAKIFNVPMEYFFSEDIQIRKIKEKPDGMESLTELYKIGRGPSSSHTIGPERACTFFRNKNPDADNFRVILYGSLAKTGRGHGTDRVIRAVLAPHSCKIEFNMEEITSLPHPNTMDMFAYRGDELLDTVRVQSVGGGKIVVDGHAGVDPERIYKLHTFEDIREHCNARKMRIWQYVAETEGDAIESYLMNVWYAMKQSIQNGLDDEGILPGGLNVHKKAKYLLEQEHIDESAETRENRLICAYAFAVSEQNASGGEIVTAPTCGASGVLPAVMYYQQQKKGFSDLQIVRALMTAGLIGNLIKTNASISGAECGCQAEIGSACAMTAAALGELFGLHIDKIEYAAEIAIEHHLGLTCDPICGLVQIPCIERNAVAAMRAINAVNLASFLSSTRKISLDKVIHAMMETGHDLADPYKETAEGGLARIKI